MTEAANALAGAALLAICTDPDGDHAARLAAFDETCWSALAELAGEQRAAPLVKRAADRASIALAVPPQTRHVLRHWHLFHVRAMLAQRQALAAALAVLAEGGMRPVLLKGVALAYRDYPDPALRPMRDFDLLLRPEDAEAAQSLLLGSGRFALDDEGAYGIEYGHQLPELIDRQSGALLEVHHRLDAGGWREEPELVARMLLEAVPLEMWDGFEVCVPAPHANFLHLAEHATLHHLFDNGPLVLADLHFAAQTGRIDWPRLLAEADELGLARAIRLVAQIALRHGATWVPRELRDGAAVPPAYLDLADAALLRSDGERKRLARLRRLELRTGARPGWRAAVRAMLRPGARGLAEASGRAADDPLRWLAYPAWLLDRLRLYGTEERSGVAAASSTRQVGLHRWLHGDEADSVA